MKCGQNSGRCFMLTVCSLQIVSTAIRQVFDFLGFMWLPIIANFFNFIFVIFGFFGAFQYKPKYILTYVIWLVAWVSWNVFITCFYLNIGVLDNKQDWLNFGTGSASWWEVNGPACRPIYPLNLTAVDPFRPLRPDRVEDCLLDYVYVETVQAALQCFLAAMGIAVSLYLLAVLTEEDDTYKTKMRAASMYSVEYSPNMEDSADSIDLNDSTGTAATAAFQYTAANTASLSSRRAKRHHRNRTSSRSRAPSHPTPQSNFANNYTSGSVGSLGVIANNGASAVPTVSGNLTGQRSHGRSSQRRHGHGRQSGRRRPQYVNPVTQLMDADSSTSTDSQRVVGAAGAQGVGITGRLGHSNPMYVHSRPGSLHSLVNEPPVERPPSVHSSYSNYHGVRASLQTAANNNTPSNALVSSPATAAGLPFARSGKGLRGSQNSILGSEARRTALTASEIRVPPTPNDLSGVVNSNAPSSVYHQIPQPIANPVMSHLSPNSVTSVTNISPTSIISQNTSQSSDANRPVNHHHHHNNINSFNSNNNVNRHGIQYSNQQHINSNNNHHHHIHHNPPHLNGQYHHHSNIPSPLPHNIPQPHSPPPASPPYSSPYNPDQLGSSGGDERPPPYTNNGGPVI